MEKIGQGIYKFNCYQKIKRLNCADKKQFEVSRALKLLSEEGIIGGLPIFEYHFEDNYKYLIIEII